MKLVKSYRKLYKNELDNRKLLMEQNSRLSQENVKYQQVIQKLKEELAKVKIELEDTQGFLKQEKEAKEELLKQRTQLRKLVTKLGGDWKNGK